LETGRDLEITESIIKILDPKISQRWLVLTLDNNRRIPNLITIFHQSISRTTAIQRIVLSSQISREAWFTQNKRVKVHFLKILKAASSILLCVPISTWHSSLRRLLAR
jgi:L-amino acid N-acyltransferase YncA